VAEDPEQVLPQQRAAAPLGVEELGAEAAVKHQQQTGDDEGGEREQDHARHHQHRPREHGHPAEGHAGGPHLQHPDDDLDAGGDRRDLGHPQPQHPEVQSQVR
jgi:hypothetical protein